MIGVLSAGTDEIVTQSDVTPEEELGITEEKEIDDLFMQIEKANRLFAFLLCFLNLLQEAQGETIRKRLADKKIEDISAPGQFEARSTHVKGLQ